MVSAANFLRYSHEGAPSNANLERYISTTTRRCYIIGPKCIFGRPHPVELTQYLMKNDAEVRSKNRRVLQKYELVGVSKERANEIYLEFVMGSPNKSVKKNSLTRGNRDGIEQTNVNADFQRMKFSSDAATDSKTKDNYRFGGESSKYSSSPFGKKKKE